MCWAASHSWRKLATNCAEGIARSRGKPSPPRTPDIPHPQLQRPPGGYHRSGCFVPGRALAAKERVSQGIDAGQAFETIGQARQKLRIAPAAPLAAHGARTIMSSEVKGEVESDVLSTMASMGRRSGGGGGAG